MSLQRIQARLVVDIVAPEPLLDLLGRDLGIFVIIAAIIRYVAEKGMGGAEGLLVLIG